MDKTYTKRAFLWLLVPICYVAVFAVLMLLARITEFPTQRDMIYTFCVMVAILLMLAFPIVQVTTGIKSIVYQVKALRNGESKVKNCAMMAVAVVYFAAAAVYSYRIWLGIMSV